MRPYRVTEAAFHSCDTTAGQPITDTYTSDVITVRPEFLEAGHNYFIGKYLTRVNFSEKEISMQQKTTNMNISRQFPVVYYRSKKKLQEGIFFTSVCQSFCPQGGLPSHNAMEQADPLWPGGRPPFYRQTPPLL